MKKLFILNCLFLLAIGCLFAMDGRGTPSRVGVFDFQRDNQWNVLKQYVINQGLGDFVALRRVDDKAALLRERLRILHNAIESYDQAYAVDHPEVIAEPASNTAFENVYEAVQADQESSDIFALPGEDGCSALEVALRNNKADLVQMIVDVMSDESLRNLRGWTEKSAEDLIRRYPGEELVLESLIRRGLAVAERA